MVAELTCQYSPHILRLTCRSKRHTTEYRTTVRENFIQYSLREEKGDAATLEGERGTPDLPPALFDR